MAPKTDSDGQPTGARLLLVDDEPSIRDSVGRYLSFVGYDVRTAATGHEALNAARDFLPELILLDIMLPDEDGLEVLRRIRSDELPVAVIFLTARDSRKDVVAGLTAGGDDYITKPFGLDEVTARVEAVLRRTRQNRPDPVLRVADLELDTIGLQVRRAGKPVHLSPTEFRLLRYLMLHHDRVLTRAQLLEHVWSYGFGGDAGVVANYINYLRRKVDAEGPQLIHTQRGVGYAIRTPAS